MITHRQKDLYLKQLDEKLSALPSYPILNVSWIKMVRTTLGMTLNQLGKRLGINRSSVSYLEKAEENSSITLKSLKNVANELDCDLVYYFKPRNSLKDFREESAYNSARERVNRISHTMALENQSTGMVDYHIEEEKQSMLYCWKKAIWS
jgi:predicted DNA-binding mobile mystery protein A